MILGKQVIHLIMIAIDSHLIPYMKNNLTWIEASTIRLETIKPWEKR
jgi:hypothetical protein